MIGVPTLRRNLKTRSEAATEESGCKVADEGNTWYIVEKGVMEEPGCGRVREQGVKKHCPLSESLPLGLGPLGLGP